MTARLLSTRIYASNIFQENRHHLSKDSIRDSSRWKYVHGENMSTFFCTEQGRSKPFLDVSAYLPKPTFITSQKPVALTLTGLRASVFIYYLSVWRQMYTLSVLKMVAAGFFETSVTLPLYMASHPTEPSRISS